MGTMLGKATKEERLYVPELRFGNPYGRWPPPVRPMGYIPPEAYMGGRERPTNRVRTPAERRDARRLDIVLLALAQRLRGEQLTALFEATADDLMQNPFEIIEAALAVVRKTYEGMREHMIETAQPLHESSSEF